MNSFCTGQRTFSKFYLTANRTRALNEPDTLLVEKAAAYYRTDKNTPFIGELLHKVKEICEQKKIPFTTGEECRYRATEMPAYPNNLSQADTEYATSFLLREMPTFQPTLLTKYLQNAKTLRDLRGMPPCETAPITRKVRETPQRPIFVSSPDQNNLKPVVIAQAGAVRRPKTKKRR
jgi:hypothetical protein